MSDIRQADRESLGKYLLDRIQQMGADHIFTVPGDYLLPFNKTCETHELKQINGTRENTAAFMADAYARLRGIGAVCFTYGVGVNVISAVSQAFAERTPLIFISGAPSRKAMAGRFPLHHMIDTPNTQFDLFKTVTADQARLDDPSTAANEIDRVLATCHRERRPVYFEIPKDVVFEELEVPKPHLAEAPKPSSQELDMAISQAREMLLKAKRPVIWAGENVRRFGLGEQLMAFAEKYQVPVTSAVFGKTVIDEHHPLYMGVYRGALSPEDLQEYMNGSDCVLVLGVKMNDVNTGSFTAKLGAQPSIVATPDTLAVNEKEFQGVCFKAFAEQLLSQEELSSFTPAYPHFRGYYEGPFAAMPDTPLRTDRVFACLQQKLTPEHILTTGIGDSFFASIELRLGQNNLVTNGHFFSLGFCVPAALGCSLACPERRVVAIVGDGDFQMSGMEIGTATRYGLDPIVILLNNHGYGIERPLLEGEFNDVCEWHYHKLSEVIPGGQTRHCKTEEDLLRAVQEAFSSRGSWWLIEAELEKSDLSTPLRRFTEFLKSH